MKSRFFHTTSSPVLGSVLANKSVGTNCNIPILIHMYMQTGLHISSVCVWTNIHTAIRTYRQIYLYSSIMKNDNNFDEASNCLLNYQQNVKQFYASCAVWRFCLSTSTHFIVMQTPRCQGVAGDGAADVAKGVVSHLRTPTPKSTSMPIANVNCQLLLGTFLGPGSFLGRGYKSK